MDANFYGELAEVFLANSCKTEPIMVANAKGEAGRRHDPHQRVYADDLTRGPQERRALTANPNIKYRCSMKT
jgi:hypothetical protein